MVTVENRNWQTYLRCQTDYFAPSLRSQIGAHDPTYARAQHLPFVVQEYRGVVIEPNESSVWSPHGFCGAHYDSSTNVASTDFDSSGQALSNRGGACTFEDANNLVPDATVPIGDFILQNIYAFDNECTRVVDDLFVVGSGRQQNNMDKNTNIEAALKSNHAPKVKDRGSLDEMEGVICVQAWIQSGRGRKAANQAFERRS